MKYQRMVWFQRCFKKWLAIFLMENKAEKSYKNFESLFQTIVKDTLKGNISIMIARIVQNTKEMFETPATLNISEALEVCSLVYS
jgi:hypothetical protein